MDSSYTISSATTGTLGNSTVAPQRVIPLLQALSRVEDGISALTLRLDPVINHIPADQKDQPASTVTSRLVQVGDVLQYLLDNIEL